MSIRWALAAWFLLMLHGCNSPFQVKQDYSPRLVVYAIAFRGDSTLVIRVETNSENSRADSSHSPRIDGLRGVLSVITAGLTDTLIPEYANNVNLLRCKVALGQKTGLGLRVQADGYPDCTSSLTVLDSAIIYPAFFTNSVLMDPSSGQPDPKFTVYPSPRTFAIRMTILLKYDGVDVKGSRVAGEIPVNPAYERDTTSYFLRINGAITDVYFNLSDYSSAFAEAMSRMVSGRVTAVVRLIQVDAPVYNFYSISNGFNDPLTMRTERPVYTNVGGGLGFFGSASYDSLSIQVYP